MLSELIHRIPLFAALPTDELELLSASMHPAGFPAGSILFKEGDPGDRFSIILHGQVEIIKALDTPDETLLAVLRPEEFLGEMSLLDPDRLRSASARARSDVQLLEMTHADFDALLQRRPELALGIMQEMSERLRNSENAALRDLQEKNRQLAASRDALAVAYQELQVAQAQIIQKEKLEHEMNMARRIQASMLPKEVPTLEGWQLAAYWQPARSVSGDFYDFIPFPDGRWGLVIGDVTDKGVPAALVMATTRSVIRSTALSAPVRIPEGSGSLSDGVVSPGEILVRVNELLVPDMPANMFVTCLFAILDPSSGLLRFANAGHNIPYKRSVQGVSELHARGMPLGLLTGMTYEENETGIEPGDQVLFYSDGLVEAHNPKREMFGSPRLRENFAAHTAGSLIDELVRQLGEFSGPGWDQEDDVTLVTLERE